MRKKFLLLFLLICFTLINSSDSIKQESNSIELVIIDSGISKKMEYSLPNNWSIKHYNSKENKKMLKVRKILIHNSCAARLSGENIIFVFMENVAVPRFL